MVKKWFFGFSFGSDWGVLGQSIYHYWNYIKFKLRKYRGVMSHDTRDWCRIFRKTDLLFQKWEEFNEFHSKDLKVSKIWTLICPFWAKFTTFNLKKCREVIFHDSEEYERLEERLACGLENDMRNLANFPQNIQKSQKYAPWWALSDQSIKCTT